MFAIARTSSLKNHLKRSGEEAEPADQFEARIGNALFHAVKLAIAEITYAAHCRDWERRHARTCDERRMVSVPCKECGKPFSTWTTNVSGRHAEYCSPACRTALWGRETKQRLLRRGRGPALKDRRHQAGLRGRKPKNLPILAALKKPGRAMLRGERRATA